MFDVPQQYDVIVVGSGHAGIEAALAAARIGASTLLLTQNLDTIGQMSCNPAIGGTAKGHIVREIDALDGAMARMADATGIHFRLLNRSKGPSVQALRVQCDKKKYQLGMKALVENTSRLQLKQATVTRLEISNGSFIALETDIGFRVRAQAAVMTSGTFLRGLLHVGETSKPGGRMADASSSLSDCLRSLGFEVRRFKTGTPCRVDARSIDFSKCHIQNGDVPPDRFSFLRSALGHATFHVEQLPCWITHTTKATHQIIRANLHRSPLYAGRIKGLGPRYCPSIEDKVVKFPDKTEHQIFLEPEGRKTREVYVNGISTSLPYDVQVAFVRSIPGLERAELMRPGYAVEYDYFPPTQLHPSLETKRIRGLYFAGQVNGTSGYEEAAAQGLIAGANAALKALGRDPFIRASSSSYVGVMLEDLTIRGTDEPYRMFTSRAENRLLLRHDTADQRLTSVGYASGLITAKRWQQFTVKSAVLANVRELAQASFRGIRIVEAMKRADFHLDQLPPEIRAAADDEIWSLVATEAKYDGYIRRQDQQTRRLAATTEAAIPDGFEFDRIPGLRRESRQTLARFRPTSVAQLRKMSGITPADVSIIQIWLMSNREQARTKVRR